MAAAYRRRQKQPEINFDAAMQEVIVATAREAGAFITATVHAVATELTHVHMQLSWRHNRTWKSMRASVRMALSRALNQRFGKCEWFSDTPSRRSVRDHEHFDYLMLKYLPEHNGAKWFCNESVKAAEARDAMRAVSVMKRGKRKSK